MQNRFPSWLTILLLGIAIILFYQLCNTASELNRIRVNADALSDSLHYSRDRLGRETAVTAALTGTVQDFKNINAGKDSVIARLKDEVSKKTIALAVIQNATRTRIVTPTTVEVIAAAPDSDRPCPDPVYTTTYSDHWSQYTIRAGSDSIYLDHKAFNEFVVEERRRRRGLFKAQEIELRITNANPNTTTLRAEAYVVKNKQNRSGWLAGGWLLGVLSYHLLFGSHPN
ncbi:MAG TPA: hypothetical protein PKZ07_14760 [Sedimentisphaerales bacterium]|nr:hypothetical protein [Sedimentisphaerales bacterium]